jgi:hypothetical protein
MLTQINTLRTIYFNQCKNSDVQTRLYTAILQNSREALQKFAASKVSKP